MATKKPSQPRKRGAGRPPALTPDEKTLQTIEGLAKIQCTQAECAAVLGVSRSTLDVFFKKHPEARAKWDVGPDAGKASLRRNQFKLSETNAAMAIWLGKQYLGQKDETHQRVTADIAVSDARDKLAHLIDRAAAAGDEAEASRTTH